MVIVAHPAVHLIADASAQRPDGLPLRVPGSNYFHGRCSRWAYAKLPPIASAAVGIDVEVKQEAALPRHEFRITTTN